MRVLKNKGTAQILSLMGGSGKEALKLIELAGRVSHQSQDKITSDSAAKFVKRMIDRGHESVLEHSAMTVQFDNISIGMTRELCRHRLCSITERSTRYVSEKDFDVVFPPHRDVDETVCDTHGDSYDIEGFFEYCERVYKAARDSKWPAEDARQILPLGIVSQIVVTTNFREWRHIFKERTAKGAHWEIKKVMIDLLHNVQKIVPVVFDDIIPA